MPWTAGVRAPVVLDAAARVGLDVDARLAPGELLQRSGVQLSGKHVVVLGRSLIVGKPVALLAMQRKAWANATVTVCHSQTANIASYVRQADVLIAAIGRPEFVTADMVKPGAVVIDVGINRVADPTRKAGYRLVGDVHFPSVAPLAGVL